MGATICVGNTEFIGGVQQADDGFSSNRFVEEEKSEAQRVSQAVSSEQGRTSFLVVFVLPVRHNDIAGIAQPSGGASRSSGKSGAVEPD
jgi:hypothetical protein